MERNPDPRNRDLTGMDADAPGGDQNKTKHMSKDLAFIFSAARDNFPAKPYAEDGNPDFYTEDAIKERSALKENPVVSAAIADFLTMFQKTGPSSNRVIPKEEYFRVFMHIGMILRPGVEHEELSGLVKKDFDDDCMDRDSAGQIITSPPEGDEGNHRPYGSYDYIDERKLYDAIFELVDTWVPSMYETEYKSFLE